MFIKDSAKKGDLMTVFGLHNNFEITYVWSRLACSSAYDEMLFTKFHVNRNDNFVNYLYKKTLISDGTIVLFWNDFSKSGKQVNDNNNRE